MIVTQNNLNEVLDGIERAPLKGFDVESFGTKHQDRLFSIIISTPVDTYYFNFNDTADHLGNIADTVLKRERTIAALSSTFKTGVWAAHNAKFDCQKIYLEGHGCPKNIHCTLATERLIRNDMLEYSLDTVAKLYGYEKDSAVEEYINKHKLYTRVLIPGKKKLVFDKHFDQVPFEIIRKYGEQDAKIHRLIAEQQRYLLAIP
jgi:hypothetical protein